MSTATAIGVDFGGTSVKPGVVKEGVILEKGNVIPTTQDGNVDALIGMIVAEIKRLKKDNPDITAAGFGLPGIIDPAEGMVVNLTNVKGWRDIPLREIV
jgi:glucokinase